jgi:dephospho-CoA kinase
MARVLVTGMSGAGKSSALAELARRGYTVVETDDGGWCECVTHADVDGRPLGPGWVWRERRMAELLADHGDGLLFVSGCVSNQPVFYDRFDAIVLLTAPAEILLQRVAERTTNTYGKQSEERALIEEHITTVEPLLRSGATDQIDTRTPLHAVVEQLIRIGEAAAPAV